METRPSISNPPSLSGPDDEGFWMEEDFSTIAASTVREGFPNSSKVSEIPAVITKYYTVTDEEGSDDVFIPCQPAEGSAPTQEGNTCVTLVNGAADATEAAANPGSLPWHHGEEHLGVAHGVVEEVSNTGEGRAPSTWKLSREATGEGGAQPKHDGGDIALLSGVMDLWGEATMEIDKHSKPKLAEKEEHSEADHPVIHINQSGSASEPGEQEQTRSGSDESGGDAIFSRMVPDCGTCETKDPDGHDKSTRNKQEEKVWGIATKIKQGEELLQRLQLVQQRQDEHRGDSVPNLEQLASQGAEQSEAQFGGKAADVVKMDVVLNTEETVKITVSVDVASMAGALEHPGVEGKESVSKRCTAEDASAIPAEGTTSFLTTKHRFSAAETASERQAHEVAQENLQRSEGVYDLSENPDVLEIPFKSTVELEPKQDPEQALQKETPKELGTPLIMDRVERGFGKGEVSHLQETKMLFEAFQQASSGGPTRQRKAASSQIKANIYPSVLERTRSLEGFSLKSRPISRAHSLRLLKSGAAEREKSPDNLRTRSPTGGPRDKTRLSPYPKQDVRLYRSMDSISASTAVVADAQEEKQESPLLRRNPFFKLRPALAKQPMVEKDIREAKEREEELRRQRCYLYRENHLRRSEPPSLKTESPEVKQQSRGKLVGVWPPPSKKDLLRKEQTEQEPKVHRAAGQKASLWQRWESGQINAPAHGNN
ncbi:uncharacterized protein ACB058_020929 [Synchiropus picturatus]